MNKKENLQAVFEGRVPEQIPKWELVFELWDAFSGREMCLGFAPGKLSAADREKALIQNAATMIEVSTQLGFAGLSTIGGMWQPGPGDWAYLALPDSVRWQQLKILAEMVPDDLMLIGKTGGILHPPSGDGYVEFAYKLFDAPEEVDRIAQMRLADGLEMAKKLRDHGIEAIYCPADLADNHGPFFKPDQMERFVLPYLEKWCEGIRGMGMYAILHSDGQMEPVIDDILDRGLHALQALDPTAGVDIKRVHTKTGNRLALCGNVDCGILLTGSPDDVYRETAGLLDEFKDTGGLVLGASNAVVRETPKENYEAMVKAHKDLYE